MPFLIGLLIAIVILFLTYRLGRRSGYEAGRLDERKEWSTKIRELDE
ncbi:MAG: hypothetical protein IIA53_02705 [Chloroflexi bacterium]|nr:hypothetical protein [Chloroflexota bacterium]